MKRAAIYRRISRDPEGLREGVERQDEDTKAFAEKHDLEVVAEYEDNDAGASTLSKKSRPHYAAMLEAARRGEFDVILAYSNSRLTRRPLELEDLIVLHDQTGVTIQTVVSGNDDLATADGRMVARIKASVDAAEAERLGERLRRAFLQRAQRGEPQTGQRSFGWDEDKVSLHPAEAPLLRQAVEDVIDGLPTREVARRWNAAGVTTVRGNEWSHTSVRQVLRNPRLAGWKRHRGDVVRDASGQPVRGVWEPLVDQETFVALQAALDGRRPRTRRGARRYLLSTILRCGECGSKFHGYRTREGSYAYACAATDVGHSVTIAGRQTDELIVALVKSRLASVDLTSGAVASPGWPGEARLAAIPGQITDLMTAFREGTLSAAIVFPQVQALEAEQAALEAERPTAPPRPVTVSAEALPDLDVDRQRAVVEALIDAVVVAKAAHRGARWSPDRLQVVWRA